MKLHLSKSLRTAVLAAYALVSPLSVTAFSGAAAIGVCTISAFAPQAQAADISYNGGVVLSLKDGADVGGKTFNDGDSVAVNRDAEFFLASDVTMGLLRINDDANVQLTGRGNKLDGKLNIWGTLTLRDQALAETAAVTAGRGDIIIKWGHGDPEANIAGSLAGFRGVIRAQDSSFKLSPVELADETQAYSLVEVLGDSVMTMEAGTYASATRFFTTGTATINVTADTASIRDELSGTGELHKIGAGTLRIENADIYHTGHLIIEEGTVRWGSTVTAPSQARLHVDNRMAFSTITVMGGTTFDDTHDIGPNIGWQTDINLVEGGTITGTLSRVSNDVVRDSNMPLALRAHGVFEACYGKLTVTETGNLVEVTTGGHRFKELVNTGDNALLNITPAGNANNNLNVVYAAFDFVNDFQGEIRYAADRYIANDLYFSRIFNDTDHTLLVNGFQTVFAEKNLVKEGNGTTTMTAGGEASNLTVRDTLHVKGGTLNVNGAVEAEDVVLENKTTTNITSDAGSLTSNTLTVKGKETVLNVETDVITHNCIDVKAGTVTFGQNATFNHEAYFRGGVTTIGGDMILHGDTNLSGFDISMQLSGDAKVEIAGDINTDAIIAPGTIEMKGNSTMTVGGDVELKTLKASSAGDLTIMGNARVKNFSMHGAGDVRIGDGSTLTVSKVLDMNYNGGFQSQNPIHLVDNIVLSYGGDGDKVIELTSLNNTDLKHVFVDVSRLTDSQLRAGVNLGIPEGSQGFYNLSYGGMLTGAQTEIRDGYLYLTATGRKASIWDKAWGSAELATAPDFKLTRWDFKGESYGLFTTGTATNPFDLQDYYIQVDAYGVEETDGTLQAGNLLYGCAYYTRAIDATPTTIQRQVWIKVDGKFEVVTAGSCGAWNLEGDTHIQTASSAKIGHIVAANIGGGDWVGDGYISINTPDVYGNIVGGDYGAEGNHTGNMEIYIHKVLSHNDVANTKEDLTTTNTLNNVGDDTPRGNISGSAMSGGGTTTGNTLIVIDAKETGKFVKGIFGSYFESAYCTQIGDTRVVISGTKCDFVPEHHEDDIFELTDEGAFFRAPVPGGYPVIAGGSGATWGYTQRGDSSVYIVNSSSKFNFYITGGSFGDTGGPLPGLSGRTAVQYGNTSVVVDNSPDTAFLRVVAGGHLNNSVKQFLYGNSSVLLNNPGKFFEGAMVVGGHATDWYFFPAYYEGLQANDRGGQKTTGDTSVTIYKGKEFRDYIVAGHAVRDNRINQGVCKHDNRPDANVAIFQYIGGDTHLTIDSNAKFRSRVIGGHMLESGPQINGEDEMLLGYLTEGHEDCTEPDGEQENNDGDPEIAIAKIEGTAHTNITGGGSYSGSIVGGNYVDTPVDDAYRYLSHIGAVEMNIDAAYIKPEDQDDPAIVGGYLIKAAAECNANVGDIDITLSNVTVTGVIVGGSVGGGSINQGNITLNMQSGTYEGDIYMAGYKVGNMQTESTTLNLSSKCTLGAKRKPITIVGGYYQGTDNVVSGHKTLNFMDPVTYTNIAHVDFVYFDRVNVVKGAKVTMNETLQMLSPEGILIKTGEGTLHLAGTERAASTHMDVVQVREGTLSLPNYGSASTDYAILENLEVATGATLDLSAGLGGISGTLNLEKGSNLKVANGQTAGSLHRLIWGDGGNYGGKVNVYLPTTKTDGATQVELFSDLIKDNIDGIDLVMTTTEGGGVVYLTSARPYINLFNANGETIDTSGLNLVLDNDGKLMLTGEILRSVYWEAPASGMFWSNSENDRNWAMTDGGAPEHFFRANDVAVFSANAGKPHEVVVEGTVQPNMVKIIDGDYLFTARTRSENVVDVARTIYVENAKAEFAPGLTLKLNPENSNVQIVGADSSLAADNSLEFNQLISTGTLNVNGDITMHSGTERGGNVNADNVKVGGDSTFDSLNANKVTGNAEHILTLNKDSDIVSLDGGTLVVNGGTTDISTGSTTTLTALHGAGDLVMSSGGALVLKGASNIGNADAPSVTVYDTFAVSGVLDADDVTYGAMVYKRTKETAQVRVGSMTGNANFHMDESVLKKPTLWGNNTYHLMSAANAVEGLNINGVTAGKAKDVSSTRYMLTLGTAEDSKGIYLKAELAIPDYYERNATTENGRVGGKLLDNLYNVPGLLNVDSHQDWQVLMLSLDQMHLEGDRDGADRLAAAAAGVSYTALGCALQDDVYRQLRSIRNRTTTMGSKSEDIDFENTRSVNAWFNVESNFGQLKQDSTAPGYTLSMFGGTVGCDKEFAPGFTAGIAATAMFGKYSAKGPDSLSGDTNTVYASIFARYMNGGWVHTFIATAGTADFSLDRTVSTPMGNYSTSASTDGTAFGAMYEIGRVFALDQESGSCIEPVFNVAWTHTSIGGFSESGSEAGVKVGGMNNDVWRFALGARYQTTFGQSTFNRASIFEARVLGKVYAGGTQGEADVAMLAAPELTDKVKSAEMGAAGVEAGAGITVPVGNTGAVFADIAVDVTGGYTNVNGTVGCRLSF